MKPKQTEITPHAAKDIVRHLAGEAWGMTGCLPPDEMDLARKYVDDCKRVLFGIIDGRVRVVKRERKKRRS